MTTADALAALAGRVEAATGADRELDCSIAWAVGEFDRYQLGPDTTVSFHRVDDFDRAEIHVIGPRGGRVVYTHDPLRYSASLDAAMTIVPEGATWALWESGAYAVVVPSSEEPDEEVAESGEGATPALALCAAALRARATTGATDHVE